MAVQTLRNPVSQLVAETRVQAHPPGQTFQEYLDKFCDTWIDAVRRGRKAKREFREDFDAAFQKQPAASVVGGIALGALLGSLVGWAVSRRS
jgi:hypothetical protein